MAQRHVQGDKVYRIFRKLDPETLWLHPEILDGVFTLSISLKPLLSQRIHTISHLHIKFLADLVGDGPVATPNI